MAPAAAGHHPAGKLVDDDDFAITNHIVAVIALQDFGIEGGFEVAHHAGILPKDVVDFQRPLDPCDAFIGERDVLGLEVDHVVGVFL